MTNAELIDLEPVGWHLEAAERALVKSRAKRLSDVGACSKADQKIAAKTNSTKITATRFFSSVVRPPRREEIDEVEHRQADEDVRHAATRRLADRS